MYPLTRLSPPVCITDHSNEVLFFGSSLLFMFHVCLCYAIFSVPCSLVITCWDRTDLVLCAHLFICALWSPTGKGLTSWLSFVVSSVSLLLSQWYPGSGVVLDCIDS